MSTMSTFQPFTSSFYKTNHFKPFTSPINHSFALHFQKNANFTHNFRHFRLTHNSKLRRVKSAEEDAEIPETTAAVVEEEASTEPAETVAIPVSPSDKLLMFFQAEGTMSDSGIPKVTQALEETDGVSNLKVHISEGIASVELTKQTTIQATGVASSLLETIQGAGFKLQTLNLSFEDEELLVGV
ncbi:hypothetical protein BVRB_001880 [Beta vulgaris subsp. vulgaris]|uniref:Uncharacterized protein n=1 Tax=Beta vulgaris subsp. vulgaris TaxID=3555 RepID=A0A0J8DZ23_BETVV|nr:uncharacterized protein LOC104883566 [Beta vulgaris subsp. vulgaris]KMS96115.1 hypothetical protein BVRB_001880 [Beta vulgaris subsp. vulgaris]